MKDVDTLQEEGQEEDTDGRLEVGKAGTKTKVDCTHTEEGWCEIHVQAKKKFKPKKIWAKGRTGLYGWRTGRVTYFTCLEKSPIPADTPTFLMLKGGATTRRKNLNTTAGKVGKPNQTRMSDGNGERLGD